MSTIRVLDHGHVTLVDSMGNDTRVASAARVIFPEDPRGEPDEKLIRYMLKHKHWSPFEHVVFTFHVKLPIFVARQWMRHWSWSYNEVSARYKELPEEYYVPEAWTIGRQSEKNHQSRVIDELARDDAGDVQETILNACSTSFDFYQLLLEQGVPREVARTVLPVGMYTEFYATVNLRDLLGFLAQRLDEHAQWEIRQYASAIKELVAGIVPVTLKEWCNG